MSRRSGAHHRRANPGAARAIDLGPFLVAFASVLVVGALGLAGWWLAGQRRPEATAPPRATEPGPTAQPASGTAGVVLDPRADGWTSPEGDQAAGSPSAPLTLVAYSDFQCPNCRQFAQAVLPWLRRTWMANGMVKLVHRDFAIRGDASLRAAEAAHCAGEQGRFWAFHDALYAAQSAESPFERARLLALADGVDLDSRAMAGCLNAGRQAARVAASTASAHAQGFEGTPTYLIDGRRTAGAIAVADWDALFRIYAAELGWPTPPVSP